MIKTHYEIHVLQDAALQVDKVYRRAREVIREGMTDLELAAELEFTARKEGHQGLVRMRRFNAEVFYAQIFSGADTAVPAYMDAPLGGFGLNPSFGQGRELQQDCPARADDSGFCRLLRWLSRGPDPHIFSGPVVRQAEKGLRGYAAESRRG